MAQRGSLPARPPQGATRHSLATLTVVCSARVHYVFKYRGQSGVRRLSSPKNFAGSQNSSCAPAHLLYASACPNFARACGRVSVGGDLDKRPVNRPLKNRQPEANRRTPPNGGRDSKQRRTGLFRLCRPSKGRRHEEACLSCRVCGGDFPFQTMAMSFALRHVAIGNRMSNGAATDRGNPVMSAGQRPGVRLHSAAGTHRRQSFGFARRGLKAALRKGCRNDRPHPGFPPPAT